MSVSIVGDVASVATAVGVLFGAGNLFVSARQRKSQLAQSYINRYWAIGDDILRSEDSPQDLRLHHRRYLRLCEDEYEMVALGFIDWPTWRVWHDGVNTTLTRGTPERIALDSQPDAEFRLIRRCLEGEYHKAMRCPALTEYPGHRRRILLAWLERPVT